MKTAFNTGSPYTEYGQRFTVELVGEHAVFCDHDRGIDGMVHVPNAHVFGNNDSGFAKFVLQAYNYSQYTYVKVYEGEYTTPQYRMLRRMKELGYDAWIEETGAYVVHKSLLRD